MLVLCYTNDVHRQSTTLPFATFSMKLNPLKVCACGLHLMMWCVDGWVSVCVCVCVAMAICYKSCMFCHESLAPDILLLFIAGSETGLFRMGQYLEDVHHYFSHGTAPVPAPFPDLTSYSGIPLSPLQHPWTIKASVPADHPQTLCRPLNIGDDEAFTACDPRAELLLETPPTGNKKDVNPAAFRKGHSVHVRSCDGQFSSMCYHTDGRVTPHAIPLTADVEAALRHMQASQSPITREALLAHLAGVIPPSRFAKVCTLYIPRPATYSIPCRLWLPCARQ